MRKIFTALMALKLNANFCRVTYGRLGEVDGLKNKLSSLAVASEKISLDDDEDELLYKWLEDSDDICFIEAPLFEDSTCIVVDSHSFTLEDLIAAGAEKKCCQTLELDLDLGEAIGFTYQCSEGESGVPVEGDSKGLEEELAISESAIGNLASKIRLGFAKWITPWEEYETFMGVCFKDDGSFLELKGNNWGDGSMDYSSSPVWETAKILVKTSNEYVEMEDVAQLVKEVCGLLAE